MKNSSSPFLKPVLAVALAGALLVHAGCNREPAARPLSGPQSASAALASKSGSGVSGTVRFVREAEGVRIIAELTGLTPGEHGFHIHEEGDCSAPDASSAGGHFNPTEGTHAGPRDAHRHLGDLGNLTAGPDGRATLNRLDDLLSFDGPNSIVGRSVVVHAGPDDLKTQPAGDSGARVACGVIQQLP